MREIKFRAWDNVDYMSGPFDLMELQTGKIGFTSDCIIMQYTGLKDRNGKEVYEGDILGYNGKKEHPQVIEWRRSGGGMGNTDDSVGFPFYFEMFDWNTGKSEDDEIIGNIYENPELLKDEYKKPETE